MTVSTTGHGGAGTEGTPFLELAVQGACALVDVDVSLTHRRGGEGLVRGLLSLTQQHLCGLEQT